VFHVLVFAGKGTFAFELSNDWVVRRYCGVLQRRSSACGMIEASGNNPVGQLKKELCLRSELRHFQQPSEGFFVVYPQIGQLKKVFPSFLRAEVVQTARVQQASSRIVIHPYTALGLNGHYEIGRCGLFVPLYHSSLGVRVPSPSSLELAKDLSNGIIANDKSGLVGGRGYIDAMFRDNSWVE